MQSFAVPCIYLREVGALCNDELRAKPEIDGGGVIRYLLLLIQNRRNYQPIRELFAHTRLDLQPAQN